MRVYVRRTAREIRGLRQVEHHPPAETYGNLSAVETFAARAAWLGVPLLAGTLVAATAAIAGRAPEASARASTVSAVVTSNPGRTSASLSLSILPTAPSSRHFAALHSTAAPAPTYVLATRHTGSVRTVAVSTATSSGSTATVSLAIVAAPLPLQPLQWDSPDLADLELVPIWQQAGATYGIPWQILEAINKIESNNGRNQGPSSAGAIGWMQFMPATWTRWGYDANHDGVADPSNPDDAIFSAARYLDAAGARTDLPRAIYAYNHAWWYVDEVLRLAQRYGYVAPAG